LESHVGEGNPECQLLYGYCLLNGVDTKVDLEKGAKYMKMAADQGHSQAAYEYGLCLETGNGVEKNIEEAIRYYKMVPRKREWWEDSIQMRAVFIMNY
jgi:TPR repeat protein